MSLAEEIAKEIVQTGAILPEGGWLHLIQRIINDEDQANGFIRREVLEAAVRWMDIYGKPIKNDWEYIKMMKDEQVGQSYKDDITAIRAALGKRIIKNNN